MYYEPKTLDKYFVRDLKRLSENDSLFAIQILCQRLIDLRSEDYHLTLPIEELPLSTKAYNALMSNHFLTVKDVVVCGWDNLKLIRGLGPGTIAEIKWMVEKVIELKEELKGLSGNDLRNILLRSQPKSCP